LLHSLLNIPDIQVLFGHPKVGASWEGYVIEQTLSILRPNEAYFWATHRGAELDLLIFHQGKRLGVEVKFSEAPEVTRSMHTAFKELQLDHLWVIYPGNHAYPANEWMTIWPLSRLDNLAEEILS
jgi:predicted AAA+ superfamily ATPase